LALLIADLQIRKKWTELMFSIALVFRLTRALELNDVGVATFE